jgi:hypothetical protein
VIKVVVTLALTDACEVETVALVNVEVDVVDKTVILVVVSDVCVETAV